MLLRTACLLALTAPLTAQTVFPVLSLEDARVAEGSTLDSGRWNLVISLDRPSTTTVQLSLAISPGSAGAQDYRPLPAPPGGGWHLDPGRTSLTIPMQIVGDLLAEGDEQFTVSVTTLSGARPGKTAATIVILDDDIPRVILAPLFQTVTEGDAGTVPAAWTIRLSRAAAGPVRIACRTEGLSAQAGPDFQPLDTILTIPAGSLTATVTAQVSGDTIAEGAEEFQLVLASADGAIIDSTMDRAVVQITDDDARLISVSDAVAVENSTALEFSVTMAAPTGSPVSFTWNTEMSPSENSAAPGSDFTASSGTITIPAGAVQGVIRVPLQDDLLHETDESLSLRLESPLHGTLARTRADGIIHDNDAAPLLSVADTVVTRHAAERTTAWFRVSLNAVSGAPVEAVWQTRDGTATAPLDYSGNSGTVEIPAGESSVWVTVSCAPAAGTVVERALHLDLSSPNGAALGRATAAGRLLPLGISEFRHSPQGFELTFPTGPGQLYTIEQATALSGPWSSGTSYPGTGTPVTLNLPATGPSQFFRLRAGAVFPTD